MEARGHFEECKIGYGKLSQLIPPGQYYRYCDHWHYLTQRVVFLIALTIYLEKGILVSKETVSEILQCKFVCFSNGFFFKYIFCLIFTVKPTQTEGFLHLDIEDYLMGLLQLASELSRFATNSVTLGDYERPLSISRFVADLNGGFRLLNLKNDGLRKRFDALKYDVKKIEEVVYDISIRGLRPAPVEQLP